ncbi:MAG: ABC transporter permease [Gemmatimonadota bacterium]|nr:ABC transporter permease [Gemmatimonadota bacterium]
MIGRISVEQRIVDSARKRAAILGCSVLVGLLLGSAIIIASGSNVLEVYAETVDAIVGSARSVQQTLRATTPLILTGLAAAVAFRMRLYTIGAEGQLYIGAITGSGMALLLGDGHPAIYVVPAVLLAGVIGGVVWALIIAVPRAYFGTDEVVGTLMLNFIALHIMNWLIFGSVSFWRDRENLGFPGGKIVPEAAQLHQFWGRADTGIFIAVALALILGLYLKWTSHGFEWSVIGDSLRAGIYSGMNVRRQIISVLGLSGALAGMAGAMQVASVTYALEPRGLESGSLGFTGIVVAAIAGLNPRAIVPAAFVVAGITTAGPSLSRIGVSPASVIALEGILLLSVAGGQFFNHFTLRVAPAASEAPAEPAS